MDIWTIPHPIPYSEKGVKEQRKNEKSRGGEEHTKLVIVLQELLLFYRSANFDEYPRFSHEHKRDLQKKKVSNKPLLHSGS
jgi:hypothetical protein